MYAADLTGIATSKVRVPLLRLFFRGERGGSLGSLLGCLEAAMRGDLRVPLEFDMTAG